MWGMRMAKGSRIVGDTNIEWTDRVWNCVVGCAKVSLGCANCYAETMAKRLAAMSRTDRESGRNPGRKEAYESVVDFTGVRWNGRAVTVTEALEDPLRWRKPQRVFANSMSDLWHEDVPFEYIAAVFGVMAACPQHTFQILTKRPARMLEWFEWAERRAMNRGIELEAEGWSPTFDCIADMESSTGWDAAAAPTWPLPNVHLGVSCENQETADERIPLLLQCPAAVRWVSAEPLLEAVDLTDVVTTVGSAEHHRNALHCDVDPRDDEDWHGATLDWIVVGGESGPRARPFDLQSGRSILRQCADAGVPAFFKQAGSNPFDSSAEPYCQFATHNEWVTKARSWLGGLDSGGKRYKPAEDVICVDSFGRIASSGADFARADREGAFPVSAYPKLRLRNRKGGDLSELPEDLRVRQLPGEQS